MHRSYVASVAQSRVRRGAGVRLSSKFFSRVAKKTKVRSSILPIWVTSPFLPTAPDLGARRLKPVSTPTTDPAAGNPPERSNCSKARFHHPAFYEFAEVKLHGSVFSFGSCFSSPGHTFHVSIPPPGSPTRRLRQVGEPGGPRPSHPASLFCSHASSRPLQCLSSSRAGGFVRCATSSGRHDLLSVLIMLHDQQHNTLYVFRRSKPGRGSVPI